MRYAEKIGESRNTEKKNLEMLGLFHLLQSLGVIECPGLIIIQLFLVGGYTRMARLPPLL
ncbi:hypothetical protein [Paenibacillus sp. UASWS1643]|uniref:hypothetical protein n=1 Tax=Paenibacillus sp. UASWS1643 TaxID=2580422 RepID=UPI001CC31321|nr:hypothetical protein [Paenibacillus sp. UASWS1643]